MKAAHHKIFTTNAINLYLANVGGDAGKRLAKHRKTIEEHSDVEDIQPLLTRANNWHFFRSNTQIDPPAILSKTSERRLADLCDHFEKSVDSGFKLENCYEWVGRVLHHIQDMSCPAHVMPIYHVKIFSDNKADSLEKYFDDYIGSLGMADDTPGISSLCSGPQAPAPETIYLAAADRTLKVVDNRTIKGYCNGSEVELPLKKFWLPYGDSGKKCTNPNFSIEHQGFTTYGEFENTFGQPTFAVGNDIYVVDADHYRDFYRWIYAAAVRDSIQALHYFEQILVDKHFTHE